MMVRRENCFFICGNTAMADCLLEEASLKRPASLNKCSKSSVIVEFGECLKHKSAKRK